MVPSTSVGMIFWICGLPGRPTMVKEAQPANSAAGNSRLETLPSLNRTRAIGYRVNTTTAKLTPP